MTATLQASDFGASATEPAGVDATGGIRFNREDTQAGSSAAIPIPQTGPRTNYAFHKQIAFTVTATDPTTSIGNRTIKLATNVSLPTGVILYFLATGVYRQASAGNSPLDTTANGAVPIDPNSDGTYVAMTTSPQSFDVTVVSSGALGRNGGFSRLMFAVDARYTGGAGMLTLPNIIIGYDES